MGRNNEALLTILDFFYNGLWNHTFGWHPTFPPGSSLDPMRCVGCLTTASPEYHTTNRERPRCLRGEVDVPCAFEQVGRSKETVSADKVNGRPPESRQVQTMVLMLIFLRETLTVRAYFQCQQCSARPQWSRQRDAQMIMHKP